MFILPLFAILYTKQKNFLHIFVKYEPTASTFPVITFRRQNPEKKHAKTHRFSWTFLREPLSRFAPTFFHLVRAYLSIPTILLLSPYLPVLRLLLLFSLDFARSLAFAFLQFSIFEVFSSPAKENICRTRARENRRICMRVIFARQKRERKREREANKRSTWHRLFKWVRARRPSNWFR